MMINRAANPKKPERRQPQNLVLTFSTQSKVLRISDELFVSWHRTSRDRNQFSESHSWETSG
jgi:hypothetical protein